MRATVPNHLRPKATAEQRAQAELDDWQAEQKFLARRGQAARAQGGKSGQASRPAFGRSPDVHKRQSPVRGRPVRAAESPSVGGFLLALVMLFGFAMLAGLGLIVLALWRLVSLGWDRISGRES